MDGSADRGRQRRRLVPGADGVGRARARQPQHPGRSAAAPTCATSSTRRSSSARNSARSRRRSLDEALDEYFVGRGARSVHDAGVSGAAEKRAVIPAVTHVDGSGRLQTVSREHEPALLGADSGVRPKHRRAGAAEHVVQRERADRAARPSRRSTASCGPTWTCSSWVRTCSGNTPKRRHRRRARLLSSTVPTGLTSPRRDSC